jgi:hypothetical protein
MIYVVSGMARTGTSMMMHALVKGGIPAIYEVGKDIRVKMRITEDYDPNPNGLFEITHEHLLERFPDDLDGEAVKIHDWQWAEIGERLSEGLMVVYMTRPAGDILDSLCRFTGRKEPSDKMIERANMQFEVAQAVSMRKDAVDVVRADYNEVLSDPLAFFEYLELHGFPINPVKAASIVNPEYRHFRQAVVA